MSGWRRRDWRPTIPMALRWPLLVLWALEPIARGIDYVTGDREDTTSSLTFIEAAMPLQWWGVLCLVAGVGIISGFVVKVPALCIAGLHVAGATYATLTVGLLAKAAERGFDGFRTPVMFGVIAAMYWIAALGYVVQLRRESKGADD